MIGLIHSGPASPAAVRAVWDQVSHVSSSVRTSSSTLVSTRVPVATAQSPRVSAMISSVVLDEPRREAALRRAAVLLIKADRHRAAAALLAWVDHQDAAPAIYDLAAEMDVLVPQMHDSLGPDAIDVMAAGADMSLEEAMAMASATLREAAEHLTA